MSSSVSGDPARAVWPAPVPNEGGWGAWLRVSAGGAALLLVGALLVGFIWLASSQRIRSERAEAIAAEISKNRNLTLAVDVHTTLLFRGIDQLLRLIKEQYEQAGPRLPLARVVAPGFSASTRVTLIAVIDERGDVVESVPQYPPDNAADREVFRAHQRSPSDTLLVSPPVLGRLSGRWVITLSRRINKPDGTFGGVTVVSVEPRYLTSLFESTTLGASDVMSLILESGITLARRRGPTIEFGADVSSSQLMVEYARQREGSYIGPGGVDGVLRIFTYRRLADYPVIATVGSAEADALAPAARRARTYRAVASLVSLAIALVCVTGTVLLARQQRTNQRLLEQASLLDEAQDAIMVSSLDGRLTFWNRGAVRLYGWSTSEAIGRRVTDLLYTDADRAAAVAALEQAVASGNWLGELRPTSRDGRHLVIQNRWTLVRDAAGRPVRLLGIDTDITERRELERQFYRAQRLESLGTLAGGIAHDLNNVLAPIMLAGEALREQAVDVDTRDLLTTIVTSARRGADMVGQVLAFARGRDGVRTDVSIPALFDDVVRSLRDTFPKTIAIVTRVAPGLPSVVGDATQLHQVLLNLCVNARDAMPQGGTLSLMATMAPSTEADATSGRQAAGRLVLLQVEDTGSGIPAAIVEKVFDPFFTTKPPGHGTGLGLSTSLTIVRNHGGHVRVDSEPGRGTRFDIYLPASPATRNTIASDGAARDTASHPSASAADRRRQVVLVVDDEEPIRRTARRILEGAGYPVVVAANGAEAVEAYRRHEPRIAVVLTDMTMPVLDGAGVIDGVRAVDPSARVILMSGIGTHETMAREAQPVVHFLAKPYTAERLLAAVAETLAT